MNETGVLVSTIYGPVRGHKRVTCMGRIYYSFRGIPYAKPPVGGLRFKDPQPPEPWTLPKCATKPGRIAMGVDYFHVKGTPMEIPPQCDEDCLLLNVYTPEIHPVGLPLPVMVYIHGGGFRMGSGDESLHGADYLLEHNVCIVTINYRMGAFGFLSLDDPHVGVPGNAGLKDQTMALQWVRQNARRFGGDASNVTLFGHSAGAICVHLHMLAEMSRGLFDKAIVQSGTLLSPVMQFPNNGWAQRLARRLGWSGKGGAREVHDFLLEASAEDIVRQQDGLLELTEVFDGVMMSFGPVSEPYRSGQTFYASRSPDELLHNNRAASWSANMPLLIGTTSEEGFLFWRDQLKIAQILRCPIGVVPLIPHMLRAGSKPSAMQRVLDFYRVNARDGRSPTAIESRLPVARMWGDRYFMYPMCATVAARVRHCCDGEGAATPTYVYRFSKDSRVMGRLKGLMMGSAAAAATVGACHGEELQYLFRNQCLDDVPPIGSNEAQTIERMTDIWTHFAKTGDPTTAKTVKSLGWRPARTEDERDGGYQCLNIDDELTVEKMPEAERVAFWRELLTTS